MKHILLLMLGALLGAFPLRAQWNEDGTYNVGGAIPRMSRDAFEKAMVKPVAWQNPPWWIHAEQDELTMAYAQRNPDKAPSEAREKLERKNKQFRLFLEAHCAAGKQGRDDKKPTITMTPLEFIALYFEPGHMWDDALGKWPKYGGPAATVQRHLRAAAYRVRLMKTPSEEDIAFAERMEAVLAAFEAHLKGKAKTKDLDTLKAFVAEMKAA